MINLETFWLNEDGVYHRDDGGPALIYSNGSQFWYVHGKLHRDDGPAIEWDDGDTEWYVNGVRHKEDGPAIEFQDGDTGWYLNGKYYYFEIWCEKLNKTKEEQAFLKLRYF